VQCTTYFDTMNCLRVDQQCDRQTDRQTDKWTPGQREGQNYDGNSMCANDTC